MKAFLKLGLIFGAAMVTAAACSANDGVVGQTSATGGGAGTIGTGGGGDMDASSCGSCLGNSYMSCESGSPTAIPCPESCTPGKGCTTCSPLGTICVGNEVHACSDGQAGALVKACDVSAGQVCNQGACVSACEKAESDPSNIGCEFWAADLDMADLPTNPAATEWGLVIANASQTAADVTIELNEANPGEPVQTKVVWQGKVEPDSLAPVSMPTRELDCGAFPNDHDAPGTCLSSRAFRVSSNQPVVVYQFNNLVHGFSTDASLLIPTTSLGTKYRVIGWPAAHSYPSPGAFVERAYVTIVGTKEKTHVTVYPYWRIRGNAPIAATKPGGLIDVDLGPFDVLNLETDDATFDECFQDQTPPYCADLTSTVVVSDKPVAVFSGTEASGVGVPYDAPKYPGFDDSDPSTGCCLQHLEEQLFPMESIGKDFVITRSPVRSTLSYEEPDILRFVGAAEEATVTTNLPAPYDSFTIKPGEVKETWTQDDVVVSSDKPILIGQFLVAQGYVQGVPKGDPSFTIFPPVEQAQQNYVFLSPNGWKENWVVISAEVGTSFTIDGTAPSCETRHSGDLKGKTYESHRCKIPAGVHRLVGDKPINITVYGYADADTYSFAGGAAVKKIYEPPVIK